jgi:preprotein translocase subunit SecD
MKRAALLLVLLLPAPALADGASFEMRVVVPCGGGDTQHLAPDGEQLCFAPDVIADRSNLERVGKKGGPYGPVLDFQLDAAGTGRLKAVTTAMIPTESRIAILYDGKVMSAPHIMGPIADGSGEIAGLDPDALKAAVDDLSADMKARK